MANLLFNTAPLFIPVIGCLIFNEKVNTRIILSIITGIFGILVIFGNGGNHLLSFTGLVGLLSGLSLAFSQIILHRNIKRESNLSCMFWLYLFSSLFSAIIYVLDAVETTNTSLSIINFSDKQLLAIVGITISTLFYQFFTGLSYKLSSVVKLAPFIYTSVLFSGLLDFIFWDKVPGMQEIIGMIILAISCIFTIKEQFTK